jgi:hypothetical protein
MLQFDIKEGGFSPLNSTNGVCSAHLLTGANSIHSFNDVRTTCYCNSNK